MKNQRLSSLISLIFLILFVSPGSAYAVSTSFNQANLNWASLTFSGIPITFLEQDSVVNVSAQNDDSSSFFFERNPGFVQTVGEVMTLGAFARGETNDAVVGGSSSVSATGSSPTTQTSGFASAFRTGLFRAEETGNLTTEIDFSLSQALTTENIGETAFGFAEATLQLTGFFPRDNRMLFNEVTDGSLRSVGMSGTLSVTEHFNAGEEVAFFANTNIDSRASSPIPEPSTFLLLGSGLVGWALWRWKTGKQK